MQSKLNLAQLLAATLTIPGIVACGKLGIGEDKANNQKSAALSGVSDGVVPQGQEAPSAQISLEDLNKVIARFDPVKLMKRLGKTGDFNFETKKISTSSDLWLNSGLKCEASDPELSDVKCAMIGYRDKEIASFPPGRIGTYFFTKETLIALCDLAPGEWVLSNDDSRILVKPQIEGLPWGCSKFRVPGYF